MVINLINCRLKYEMEKLSMAFYPHEKFEVHELSSESASDGFQDASGGSEDASDAGLKEDGIITILYQEKAPLQKVTVRVCRDGREESREEEATLSAFSQEELAGRVLYRALSALTGLTPPWGILTGVRPSKLMTKLLAEEGEAEAKSRFEDDFLVSKEKAELALRVSKAEEKIIATSGRNSYSLYLSIPFCPNRCSYCSFVSHSIASPGARKLLPIYVEQLQRELEETGSLVKNSTLSLESVYIGGGTPSSLSAEQITAVLDTIRASFDLSHLREFTFEAGRPDTMHQDKWKALKQGGVTRVSINPQTMTDSILASVGRYHTAEDIKHCFREARAHGFCNINMDLIAGLPGDTPENFSRSLRDVLDLDPEAITVHTLAYKRSSDLIPTEELFSKGKETATMVSSAGKTLQNAGFLPYYMYRQTRSVGNLENVGFCKPGFECYYNVYMMEECHSILACGAGAVTKLKVPGKKEISRLFNFKYPYEYNTRFDELRKQKERLAAFLATYHA